jgi:hypothetical protein
MLDTWNAGVRPRPEQTRFEMLDERMSSDLIIGYHGKPRCAWAEPLRIANASGRTRRSVVASVPEEAHTREGNA